MENSKSKNVIIGVLIVIILLLLSAVGYLIFEKNTNLNQNDESENSTTTTTTTTTNNSSLDDEDEDYDYVDEELDINDAVIEEFYDIATKQKYYLATFTLESDGDIYDATVHIIYDVNYKKIATIPELSSSHIWKENGESIFGVGTAINVTAHLMNNKIYSLDDDECDFIEYESYIENGVFKSNVIKNISSNEVNISGMKC